MTDLASQTALDARFRESYHVSGQFETTTIHFPCPFCAARDWYDVVASEFGTHMDPHYCVECGRSARFVFTPTGRDSQTAELVQCYGPDAPAWMPDPPRREDQEDPRRAVGYLETPITTVTHSLQRAKKSRMPPGFRKTSSSTVNCHTCKSVNRRTGFCAKFMWKVAPSDVCNDWSKRKGS